MLEKYLSVLNAVKYASALQPLEASTYLSYSSQVTVVSAAISFYNATEREKKN